LLKKHFHVAFLQYFGKRRFYFCSKNTMEKRYNLFSAIHKGLRRMLFEVQLRMQQADFADPAAEEVLLELERLLGYYEQHGEHEDKYIFPHLTAHAPHLVDTLTDDHQADKVLTAGIHANITRFRDAKYADDREAAGRATLFLFNEFIAYNLTHMNKEETELLELLWLHYSDAEIMLMEKHIVDSIAPDILMEESRWMVRSMSNPEIRNWLTGLKMHAPQPVYETFLALAQQELPKERMEAVTV
jgi:hypothetical protein